MAKKKAETGLVPVELFKDNGKYADDLTVVWNGKVFKIQRGKVVMVPPEVKEIIDHSQYQDFNTAAMIGGMEEEYFQKSKQLN